MLMVSSIVLHEWAFRDKRKYLANVFFMTDKFYMFLSFLFRGLGLRTRTMTEVCRNFLPFYLGPLKRKYSSQILSTYLHVSCIYCHHRLTATTNDIKLYSHTGDECLSNSNKSIIYFLKKLTTLASEWPSSAVECSTFAGERLTRHFFSLAKSFRASSAFRLSSVQQSLASGRNRLTSRQRIASFC